MEHIYFEAQLCSEIAILKEKSKQLKILRKSFDWWRLRACVFASLTDAMPSTTLALHMSTLPPLGPRTAWRRSDEGKYKKLLTR